MGRPKALVPWHDTPLLLHQAQVLEAAGVGEIIAVVGKDRDSIREAHARWSTRLVIVDNLDWEAGRSTSIATAARATETTPDAVLILAVDQPLALEVVEALLASPLAPGEVALPAYEGRPGHPVLLHGSLLAALQEVAVLPEGLRSLVRAAPTRLVPVASPSIHLDLNTAEALRAATEDR